MRRLASLMLMGVFLLGTAGCGDTIVQVPTAPTPSSPVVSTTRVEFRVIGTHRGVTVRYVTAQDGTVQVTTDLPWIAAFSTTAESMFLSLDVATSGFLTGVQTPFITAQILVNGNVVRETTSNLYVTTLTLNYTFRR